MTNKNLLYTNFQEIKKSTRGKTHYQYIERFMISQECKFMNEIDLEIKRLNPYCERAGVKADCLAYNNITIQPHTSTAWGQIKKCDVQTAHECTINQPSRMITDTYELTNNTWNNIEWNANDGYTNDEHLKMDNKLQSYVESSCLFLGMAGTGKSKILLEAQRILTKSEAKILFNSVPYSQSMRNCKWGNTTSLIPCKSN